MSNSNPSAESRRFGAFVLDGARQQLLRDGGEVALSPKAFRVLELLTRRAGELITKDQLLDEIWADVHVLEGVVKVCISEIRKALGETAARPRHLITVQRRGYRFEMLDADVEDAQTQASRTTAPCASCGAAVAPEAGFCSACGERRQAIAPAAAPARAFHAGTTTTQQELRQLTVLCCLGFDSAPELRTRSRSVCDAIVRSMGGGLATSEDDRLLVYFGCPRSREDDGIRAVRAALRILERVPALNARSHEGAGGGTLALRVGVQTGPGVVSGAEPRSEPYLGATAKRAAHLAMETAAGTVAVCEATIPLIRDAFELEAVELPGADASSETLSVHRAIRYRVESAGTDAPEAGPESPMVGRAQEVSLLLDRWAKAREGQGQSVLVSGEAGIGKSRLLRALREGIGEESCHWLELRGSAYHQNSAFHPVIELLRRAFHFAPEDAPEEQVARLEIGLERAELPVEEMLPFFADLLSLPLMRDAGPLQLSPELQRARTLEAMSAWLFGLADQRPLVLFAEDLHWTDPSTLEFIGMMIEQGQWYPILIVATHRPEFAAPWSGPAATNLLVLPIHPLSGKDVEAMVASLAGSKSLPRKVQEHVLAKGDGIPLFIEELTKSLLESDLLEASEDRWERTDELPAFSVPASLQDSLEARLDRLGDAKRLLRFASALGREFSEADLAAVASSDPEALESALRELLAAGLLLRRGVPPRVRYSFKHALIQDIAYRSLLPEKRRSLHARIAETLAARFPERLHTEPEGIARHYEEAGQVARALEAYEYAGERAAARSADREAIAHYRKALALLSDLPADAARDEKEIELQVEIGTPLSASCGFGSAEVKEAYGRARTLAEQLGESPRLGEVLDGLVSFYITQSQLDDAAMLVDQQLRLAERDQDEERLLSAHYCLGIIHYFKGAPGAALEHLAKADHLYDPDAHRDLLSIRGENVGVAISIWSAWALWIHGFSDQAVEASLEAVTRATRAGHQFSLAYAHAWTSVVYWNRRDRAEAIEHSERAMAVASEHGFPLPLGVARLVRLRCRPDGPMKDEDLKDFEDVLGDMARSGTQAAVPQILEGIGVYCLDRGRAEAAVGYIDGAQAVSTATGQPHWDAEIQRAKASLCRIQRPDARDEVEALLRGALEIASSQEAHIFSLRAAIDLAQVLDETGRSREAREVLTETLSWFSEGFETADCRAAKERLALLEA